MADDDKPTNCVPCGAPTVASEVDDGNACSRPRLGRKQSSRRTRRGSAAEYLLQRGDVAPNFQLQAVDGTTMQLSDFRGKKVMVCFYRHPFCPICAYTVNNLIGHYKKVRAYMYMYCNYVVWSQHHSISYLHVCDAKLLTHWPHFHSFAACVGQQLGSAHDIYGKSG